MRISLQLSNDLRGWIMCASSAVACVAGAGIIYVDVLVRRLPHKHKFRIQDSKAFLSSSLSLSFGVMVSPAVSVAPQFLTDDRVDILRPLQHASLFEESSGRRRAHKKGSIMGVVGMFLRRVHRHPNTHSLPPSVYPFTRRTLRPYP